MIKDLSIKLAKAKHELQEAKTRYSTVPLQIDKVSIKYWEKEVTLLEKQLKEAREQEQKELF